MHYTLILLLFGCLVVQTISRPAPAEDVGESEGDQAEYEGTDEEEDNVESVQEENSRLDRKPVLENSDDEPDTNQGVGAGDEEPAKDDDSFPGYKLNKKPDPNDASVKESNSNNEYQSSTKQRENERYNEKNGVNDPRGAVRRMLRTEDNNCLLSENPSNNKRIISRTTSVEERESLFENNEGNRDQQKNNDFSDDVNESQDSNGQPRYSKNYYNTMQEDVPDGKKYELHDNFNRDKRALQDSISDNFTLKAPTNPELENSADDEEAAIKKHIKKLSGEELEELLSSLPLDKRELLKKIMETNENGIDVNKREITKKAGAAQDDNGYVESVLPDSSKLQDANAGNEGNIETTSTEEASKSSNSRADVSVQPVTKTLEANNASPKINELENKEDSVSNAKTSSDTTAESTIDSNSQPKAATSKTENKRETNFYEKQNIQSAFDNTKLVDNDYGLKGGSNDPNYLCSEDENFSQLLDDESQLSPNNGNMMKRETSLEKDAESMKSLEESFPNSNSYDDDDPYSGSDMATLVRVKRKNSNLAIKKRSAGVLPDAKVAYCPYRAENDDEDNDEGNEFDDNGFYDRTSNLAKSVVKDTPSEVDMTNNFEKSAQQSYSINKKSQARLIPSKLMQTNNLRSDTISLGTDTDNVLSGVEGTDDTMMFNSGSRNRRTARKDDELFFDTNVKTNHLTDSKSPTENAPKFHENDSFGPLPRNYEGELGRNKRVRHVKQP